MTMANYTSNPIVVLLPTIVVNSTQFVLFPGWIVPTHVQGQCGLSQAHESNKDETLLLAFFGAMHKCYAEHQVHMQTKTA